MKNILIIGAGRSSSSLINYILSNAKENNWFLTVGDADLNSAKEKIGNNPNGRAIWLDATKPNDRREVIQRHDVIISLLPVILHNEVAKDCLSAKKHLLTASYVTKELYSFGDEVRRKELIFMGELGLDPGIDHMSAVKKLNELKAKGAKITAFRSYTGGLVSPESDNNPWHYKVSWNPRNIVLAGQGTAQYMENGKYKYIPYNRLFQSYEMVNVPGWGDFEAYANRDSLLYREAYGISNISNILRGTLRYKGFCEAWDAIRRIGLTDNTYPIVDSENMTYHELMDAYSSRKEGNSVKERIAKLIRKDMDSDVMEKLDWLGLFSKRKIKLPKATPAQILENLLIEKMALAPDEKDMVIMQHEFEYELNRQKRLLKTTMTLKGKNNVETAMAQLVGLPLGIFVKQLLLGKISTLGVNIPIMPEVYEPILKELEGYGVVFKEYEEIIKK